MSFNRLEADDFVVSADSITAGLWTDTETPTITTFFTSSTQAAGSSGNYYLNVFSNAATSSLEFAVNYGNEAGSGSIAYNLDVDGKSPSSTIYGQYRTLVLGDENASFSFGGITSSDFWSVSVERSRYKESLLPGSTTLLLANGGDTISLTDNSQVVNSVVFNDAGRVFQLVSGSAGSVDTSKNNLGYSTDSGSYGWFLPDIATYILNPRALSNTFANGGIELDATLTSATSSVVNPNPNLAFVAIKTGASFTANSQETISSDFVFCRPRSSQFNYSENPSFISGSTGEVIYPLFINSPTTYITTVGLYNDTNELLAVAKLSKPLQKDFTKESLIRVKLDF
jgi:hypothetical protein|tara:strand:- start:1030 stop:2052 length:1023 start_codon:yes stop_codon:yes gene_type:complete